jgi:predicted O-linked N-acetylglucosamine transferase (SPINDLY family)
MLKAIVARFVDPLKRDPAARARAVRAALEEGVAHARAKRNADAERCFLQALRLAPRDRDALNLLGVLALERLHYDAAADYFREALANGETADFHRNLGLALQALGDDAQAEAAFRRALALDPEGMRFNVSLLFHLGRLDDTTPAQLLAEHRRCMERLLRGLPRVAIPAARCADPERRLRIGYLSGDFRLHAVAYFLEPLLAARDPAAFEVHCFSTVEAEDERTDALRRLADHWHDVRALDDEALTALIVAQEIDILVDLAGLTPGHRVRVIARKPAPVQVSYLGYLGTTGVDALDYRITDARADPPGDADAGHSERLWRLPRTLWCFTPPPAMPEPLPLGERAAAGVVFGSFNRLAKVRARVLDLWAELLARVPESELWLVDVPSDTEHARVLARLTARGVAPERIRTWGRLPPAAYWDLIRRADIALDTFPYNGGATTCECLWLGVPVVSRAGTKGFARSGAAILGALGLDDLVAHSEAEYVDAAAALARDVPRLRGLQQGLRPRMRGSPLLDAAAFMRDLEAAYRAMWREACARAAEARAC